MLFILAFSSTFCRFVDAQALPTAQGVPPQQVQTPSSDAVLPGTTSPQATQTSSAVQDVSGHPFWLADLFAKGSPLHFGATVGETYDDNIFISPNRTADFLTHISPCIDFEKGDMTAANANYLNIYFAPTFFFYANNPRQNREDYDGDLYYQHQWTRLTLGFEQHYQQLTDASIDIGSLAKRTIYTTALNGSYSYNDKLSFYSTATQRITRYQSGSNVNTNEWIIDGYALYQVASKLALGVGPRVAYTEILGAPHESYQDLLLHAAYNPAGKISMTFAGGLEYLQYQGNTPSHLLPIFDFTANYNPRDGTSFSLEGSRQSFNSYDLAGETYENTAVQIGFRQRVMKNAYIMLSGSYNISNYEFGTQAAVGPRRNDNYYFANLGVEWDPKDWLKASVIYRRLVDNSNFSQNSFTDNQVDIQTSVWF
jgi:hypothetical protein